MRIASFNSTLVRLKDNLFCGMQGFRDSFNSTLVRLKVKLPFCG